MKILNLKEDIFKSILVFNDDCVLKKNIMIVIK